ncbi:hypothetical protein GDO86_002282 [Hymenochirus boettgeri]|uniref:Uncharacterized protein n=1 Tax=Hymenochirus boettgeri TaxID=247094 RepID=A0A8T2KHB0_9PIPI|nr:hypothetical protein GDO86_002282 [Hymenochirus boettgeri]
MWAATEAIKPDCEDTDICAPSCSRHTVYRWSFIRASPFGSHIHNKDLTSSKSITGWLVLCLQTDTWWL